VTSTEAHSVRIDIWLWAARFYKTRALAKQAIEGGRVDVNGQTCKPSRLVRADDEISLRREEERYVLKVLIAGSRRGPAEAARQLYREDPDAITARLAAREARRLSNAGFQPPPSKPDKRARRLIQALGDIDAM